MDLATYLNDWLILRSGDLKPRTNDSYADLIRRLISPSMGAMDIHVIAPEDIRHILAGIVEAGHERTAQLVYVLLKSALAELNPNPMLSVKCPKHRQKHPVPWNDEETACYIDACYEHPHGLPFLLAIMVGMRRGEICGLRWRDINWRTNEIEITNQRVRLASGKLIDCSPKSDSSIRNVPIPARLVPLLRASRGLPDTYICRITPSGLSHAHSKLVKRLGLPPIGLHGLRHTFATASVKNNGDVRALQAILGHSSYTVTMNIYTHPDHEMLSRAVDKASEKWYAVVHSQKQVST